MHFLAFSISFFIVSALPIFALQQTFLLQDVDSQELLIQEGNIFTEKSPYCTFNICLSLIGFDTGILEDTQHPFCPFKNEYEEEYKLWSDGFPDRWKTGHHPTTWMKNSCVWYSQWLTRTLGMETFSDYVLKLSYGNQNLTGDAGKFNGLTHAWIGSSLRISPMEQVDFIKRLVQQKLPVSVHAHESTRAILFVEELPNGLNLYGKTGGGNYAYGRQETKSKIGWFVGWVEEGSKRLAFAYMLQDDQENDLILGAIAREQLKQRLLELLPYNQK